MAAATGENRALRDRYNVLNRQVATINAEYGAIRSQVLNGQADSTTVSRLNDMINQLGSIGTQADAIKAENLNNPTLYDPTLAASLDTLISNITTIQQGAIQLQSQAGQLVTQAENNTTVGSEPGTDEPINTEQQNTQYAATGGADEDRGEPPVTGENQTTAAGTTNSGTIGIPGTTSSTGTNAGSAKPASGTGSAKQSVAATPNKRQKNPLGELASYTYQISLYMITPDAYDAFIQTGRRNITALNGAGNAGSGAFLIAQSGGINNTTSTRAPGFENDYYIDNLRMKTATSGQTSQTSSVVTEMSFQVIEPYGFSFISNLKKAMNALQSRSTAQGYKNMENPSRQFFILGLRFQGYTPSGKVVSGKEQYSNGTLLDAAAQGNGIFEKFYDIIISEMKFSIEGKAVVYNIKAASIPTNTAFNVKRGMINNNTKITASTVKEALEGPDGLFTKMNAEEEKLVANGSYEFPNVYKVEFIPQGDEEISGASIVLPNDLDKYRAPGSTAKTSGDATDSISVKATPNLTKKEITFKNSTPVLEAVKKVISMSSYLMDALKVLYTTATENDPGKKAPEEIKPDSKKSISWYNLSPRISNAKWDTKRGDFAYTITYVIQPYETPVVQSAYANDSSKYYGPHKRYEYWYTGKNTEIIKYVQTMDNTFFNVALSPGEAGSGAKGGKGPDIPNVRQPQNESNLGTLNYGLQAQNAYLTSLYDPGAYASATVSILGDPDFLIQDGAATENAVYNRFYGQDGYTINASGGQVFIEIDFKEAQDYKANTGTLSINESILFWKYPDSIAKSIKGISYMVKDVDSVFQGGKFTQTLNCTINTFADLEKDSKSDPAGRPISGDADAQEGGFYGNTGPANASGSATTQNTGLKGDPGVQPANINTNPDANVQSPAQITTPTGGGGGLISVPPGTEGEETPAEEQEGQLIEFTAPAAAVPVNRQVVDDDAIGELAPAPTGETDGGGR